MPLYPDGRCCKKCGRVGGTIQNCPRCTPCAYCKKDGHSELNCPKAPACTYCHKKGHPSAACFHKPQPLVSTETSHQTSHQTSYQASVEYEVREPSQTFRKWRSLNVTSKSPVVTDLPRGLEVSLRNLQLHPAAAPRALMVFETRKEGGKLTLVIVRHTLYTEARLPCHQGYNPCRSHEYHGWES